MTATPPLIDTFPEPVAAVCVGARRRVGLRPLGRHTCNMHPVEPQHPSQLASDERPEDDHPIYLTRPGRSPITRTAL
jgi:hypothetical protein